MKPRHSHPTHGAALCAGMAVAMGAGMWCVGSVAAPSHIPSVKGLGLNRRFTRTTP